MFSSKPCKHFEASILLFPWSKNQVHILLGRSKIAMWPGHGENKTGLYALHLELKKISFSYFRKNFAKSFFSRFAKKTYKRENVCESFCFSETFSENFPFGMRILIHEPTECVSSSETWAKMKIFAKTSAITKTFPAYFWRKLNFRENHRKTFL
jgi:hypothetical protein